MCKNKKSFKLFKNNCLVLKTTILQTRLHSSRMLTTHALTVSPSMFLVRGGVPGPGGCTWSRGVYWSQGVYLVWRGVPGPGGCTSRGVPGQVLPLPPCGQTHACEHITLPETSFAGGNYKLCYKTAKFHFFT